jgi:hypothetical protein
MGVLLIMGDVLLIMLLTPFILIKSSEKLWQPQLQINQYDSATLRHTTGQPRLPSFNCFPVITSATNFHSPIPNLY